MKIARSYPFQIVALALIYFCTGRPGLELASAGDLEALGLGLTAEPQALASHAALALRPAAASGATAPLSGEPS